MYKFSTVDVFKGSKDLIADVSMMRRFQDILAKLRNLYSRIE